MNNIRVSENIYPERENFLNDEYGMELLLSQAPDFNNISNFMKVVYENVHNTKKMKRHIMPEKKN